MCNDIRIDQGSTPLGKEFGDRTFAAADAAGQADNEAHGAASSFLILQASGLAFGKRVAVA